MRAAWYRLRCRFGWHSWTDVWVARSSGRRVRYRWYCMGCGKDMDR
ncbi:hypothetical protein SEA_REDFOX_68 [Arthrobacter phage RedFox]|nr:hypothetical protein SEA_REDFOX_68 [Arthrobacter phage RedFox]